MVTAAVPPASSSGAGGVALAAPVRSSREEWLARFPLRVERGKIVDAWGQRFRLAGVNWYGGSDVEHVVGGLHKRKLVDLARSVADMGFTVVRLPFSNQMMRDGVRPREGAIDFSLNPELEGLGPLEVLDAVVHALGACQVAVIPNNHGSFSAWGGNPDANGIWFCDQPCGDPPVTYTEEQFFADWRAIAERYKDLPWVVGYDLRNEVRPVPGKRTMWPLWCEDGRSPSGLLSSCGVLAYHDWRAAAGRAGREILGVCADKLIVVEQIVLPKQPLQSYIRHPPHGVPRDRLVLGVHCYAWGGPGIYVPSFEGLGGWNKQGSWRKWLVDSIRSGPFARPLGGCRDPRCFGEMRPQEQLEWYRAIWGQVLESQEAPVWVSELGLNFKANDHDRVWFEALAQYLVASDGDYAYWPLNGGPKPAGGSEPYGLLNDDWIPIQDDWRRTLLAPTLEQSGGANLQVNGVGQV